MAGFGGAVKLEGESEYRRALNQITQNLREVSSEMRATTSQFDKNDRSAEALAAQSDVLTRKLEEQKNKLSVLQSQYSAMDAKFKSSATAHQQLISKYDDEKAKLTQIGSTLGTTSKEYEQQKKVVDDLEKEVRQSAAAQEANEKAMSKMRVEMNNAQTDINKTAKSLDSLGKEAEDAGDKAKKGGDGFTVFKGIVSNLASSALQAAIQGLKNLAAAAVDTGKKAMEAYGEYEQLVGGVDTLFKNSSKEVQKYAANAYKTAGLSANEYMATVTSFSASLLQSLDNDTVKAAKAADTAITDMADNANKMGTSMEMIQNAYQGFAKQNYTMLDNLKLGYGGTKTEMERLLKDAEKLTGIKYDIKNLSDVYEAIHVIQTELGITGTTAKEASTTMQGSASSMKSAWENLLAGMADENADLGDLSKKLVDSVITYLKNVIPKVAQILKQIVSTVKQTLPKIIDEFMPLLEEIFPGITEGIQTAMKVAKDLITVIGAMVAAFAVTKIVTGIASIISAISALVTGIKTAQGVWATFNAVMAANPVGAIVTVVGLLTAGAIALSNALSSNTEELSENAKATQELKEKQKELNEELEAGAKARQENIEEAGAEAAQAEFLLGKLEELNKIEHKTVEQKEEMKRIVAQLNSLLPDLNLAVNEETGELTKSTDAIRDNIKAQKELALAKAHEENMLEIAKELVKVQKELDTASQQASENYLAWAEASNKLTEFKLKHGEDERYMTEQQKYEYRQLQDAVKAAYDTYSESSNIVDEYTDQIDELNKAYDEAGTSASNFVKSANITTAMSEMTEAAKKAGIQIPQSLTSGMQSGIYAIPKTAAEINKLINFDLAIQNAGLAGEKIPQSISSGVISGQMTVQQAIDQVKAVMDVSDKAAQAYNDGAKIPKNLSTGVTDGTYTVEQANQIMQDAINFDAKVAEATAAGHDIPASLASEIRNGELLPSEAINRVQALMNWDKAIEKAGVQGLEIPTTLSNKILNGQMTVEEANNAMNRWIDLNKALQETGYTGDQIPTTLAQEVLAGKTSVEQANLQMNNWIKFQAALAEADLAGNEIPKEIEQGILSGKLKPADAIDQLNADAAKEAGLLPNILYRLAKEAGENDVQGLINGVQDPQKQKELKYLFKKLGLDADANLNDGLGNSSPSRKARQAGLYYLEGLEQGVNNQGKKRSIFSIVSGIGSSMLSKLKASLQERSPSKATEEMGVFLLQGLAIGLDKEKDSVLKDVRSVGQDITGALQDELNQNIALGAIQASSASFETPNMSVNTSLQQNALISAFKDALGGMKVELDGEVAGEFVDKTVTRLIYN